jgi:hypothetical protein
MLQAGRHLYTTTAPSCCIPASYCRLSATLQPMSNTVVNLQDNRAVYRNFVAPLKFSFDSPSQKQTSASSLARSQKRNYHCSPTLLLGALAKFRKASISFVMSVCRSVRPYGTTRLPLDGFSRNLILENFFENLSRKMKFHYNLTTITGTVHDDRYRFLIYLAQFFVE